MDDSSLAQLSSLHEHHHLNTDFISHGALPWNYQVLKTKGALIPIEEIRHTRKIKTRSLAEKASSNNLTLYSFELYKGWALVYSSKEMFSSKFKQVEN
jgi:hypothetical protein